MCFKVECHACEIFVDIPIISLNGICENHNTLDRVTLSCPSSITHSLSDSPETFRTSFMKVQYSTFRPNRLGINWFALTFYNILENCKRKTKEAMRKLTFSAYE